MRPYTDHQHCCVAVDPADALCILEKAILDLDLEESATA